MPPRLVNSAGVAAVMASSFFLCSLKLVGRNEPLHEVSLQHISDLQVRLRED